MVLHSQEQGSVLPASFPHLGLLLLYLGEDGALRGALLRSDCFKKHLLHLACREARSTERNTSAPASQGPMLARKLFSAGHPDSQET